MSDVSNREQIAHGMRRLAMGPHPDLLDGLSDPDAAISRALDLSGPRPEPPAMAPPPSYRGEQVDGIVPLIGWWIDQMSSSSRLIEERLVWFWHNHFATSLQKVRSPYLFRQQHVTVRQYATTSFADLLHAVAKDPAMLIFLDGITNSVGMSNENFGRECMELFTMGRNGGYTQADVVAASRSFTGWIVNLPDLPSSPRLTNAGIAPWTSAFLPRRHDDSIKTLLGHTGDFDLDSALDVILSTPSTGAFIATKLYTELVGTNPSSATARRLGAAFARDYQIMPLVEAIVAEPAFGDASARWNRVRTPVEKLVGILQAAGGVTTTGVRAGVAAQALHVADYLPFLPPNVGGFPSGPLLLGPHDLISAFDLLDALGGPPPTPPHVDDLLAKFGLYDVSSQTRSVLNQEPDGARRFTLTAMSPEYAVT